MAKNWHELGAIASGGTVLSVRANGLGQTWAATGGGILACSGGRWRPVPHPRPLEQPGLVASAGRDWWVAGLTGGLLLTADGGQSWAEAWIDQVREPITCFAASPRYGKADNVLLAGTGGAGVLRSLDGGRRWLLSNFGLQEFTILALAVAGDWSRRQVVYAGTADGVYRSSGAGRAWKPVGLRGLVVQALAASAAAAGQVEGGRLLAGTEGAGLYRSGDGGLTWEPTGDELGRETSVNALLRVAADGAEIWLAGTDDGGIWRSADDGRTWRLACRTGGPVLTLAEGDDRLAAGTDERGLWTSTDAGMTWQPDRGLCAWGFRRLDRAGGQRLAALAPTGGIWLSADDGRSWERQIEASLAEPVLAYAAGAAQWVAARADGLWRGGATGEAAHVLAAEDDPFVALAWSPDAGTIWAGQAGGALWVSGDGGRAWRSVEVPFAGERLLTLALASADGTPLVGTYAAERAEITLWRLADERWQPWLVGPAEWPGVALAPAGPRGEASWAALAGVLYRCTAAGWEQVAIAGHDGPATAIAGPSADGARYLIVGEGVVRFDARGGWQAMPLPEERSAAPLDLCVTASGALLCLDRAGYLWQWQGGR